MRFTNLTLLAPGGVQTDSLIGCFTAARVARLGLHANVTMVDSHMVALEPEEQILMLADGTQLPFDLLTVATGLQVTHNRCSTCGTSPGIILVRSQEFCFAGLYWHGVPAIVPSNTWPVSASDV